MRIGQQQSVLGGDHSPSYSYRGKFAKINMWSAALDGSVIVALSSSPGAETGDVLSWREMRTALIHGNVMIQDVASMQLTGDTIAISYDTKGLPFYELTSYQYDLPFTRSGPLSVTQRLPLRTKGISSEGMTLRSGEKKGEQELGYPLAWQTSLRNYPRKEIFLDAL